MPEEIANDGFKSEGLEPYAQKIFDDLVRNLPEPEHDKTRQACPTESDFYED